MKTLLHSMIFAGLWVTAGFALYISTLFVCGLWNIFDWDPVLNWQTALAVGVTVGLEIFMVWLARHTKGYVVGIVSLLVTIILVGEAIDWFHSFQSETLEHRSGGHFFLDRKTYSPTWFRITFLSLFLIPLIAWFCYPFRYLLKARLGKGEESK